MDGKGNRLCLITVDGSDDPSFSKHAIFRRKHGDAVPAKVRVAFYKNAFNSREPLASTLLQKFPESLAVSVTLDGRPVR
jgi:hypothetical protein